MLRIAFVALSAFLLLSCGNDPAQKTTLAGSALTALDRCRTKLQGKDTDGDGLSDYQELYGYQSIHANTPSDPVYYSDPKNADTDGDGRSDGEEADISKYSISGEPFTGTVQGNPQRKDYLLKLYAQGGYNGAANSASDIAAIGAVGWNVFTELEIPDGAKVLIQDLRLNSWTVSKNDSATIPAGAEGHSGAVLGKGSSKDNSVCTTGNRCLIGTPRGQLIIKTAATSSPTDTGKVVPITTVGTTSDLMNAADHYTFTKTFSTGGFLFLRANDRDNTRITKSDNTQADDLALSDNDAAGKFIVVLVSVIPSDANSNGIVHERTALTPDQEQALLTDPDYCASVE